MPGKNRTLELRDGCIELLGSQRLGFTGHRSASGGARVRAKEDRGHAEVVTSTHCGVPAGEIGVFAGVVEQVEQRVGGPPSGDNPARGQGCAARGEGTNRTESGEGCHLAHYRRAAGSLRASQRVDSGNYPEPHPKHRCAVLWGELGECHVRDPRQGKATGDAYDLRRDTHLPNLESQLTCRQSSCLVNAQ